MSDKTPYVAIPPPTIDPTILTTQQLLREIESVKDLLLARIDASQSLRDAKIESVRELMDAEFGRITGQFTAIEAWRKEQKLDTKTAVDAALQAAEKAVREQTVASEKAITKSETSASEQSKQQYATFTASLKGVSDTLADVKDRVAKIEARTVGITEQKTTQRSDTNNLATIIGIAVSLFVLIGIIGSIAVAMAATK